MKNAEAKLIIESLKQAQIDGAEFPCPRCGERKMNPAGATRNALSRYADVYICDSCGIEEALDDYFGNPPMPFNKWALPISFEEEE